VLNNLDVYRKAFSNFDLKYVVKFVMRKQKELLANTGIIRNRLKVVAAIQNAKAFLAIQKEFGSFDAYVWNFVGRRPIDGKIKTIKNIPASTKESDALSDDLKKRGFKFVGSTIIYAHMQATGLVNDHESKCFRYKEVKKWNR